MAHLAVALHGYASAPRCLILHVSAASDVGLQKYYGNTPAIQRHGCMLLRSVATVHSAHLAPALQAGQAAHKHCRQLRTALHAACSDDGAYACSAADVEQPTHVMYVSLQQAHLCVVS
jgi:hypothetical protein